MLSHSRFIAYCLALPGAEAPVAAEITASTPIGPLAVRLTPKEDEFLNGELLHTMAAKARIQELESSASASDWYVV